MTWEQKEQEVRKDEIILAALNVAERDGFNNVTRITISNAANCSEALVTHHFGSMKKLKRSLMRAAVNQGRLSIIAFGLANGDKEANKASEELKRKALNSLI